MIAKARIHHLCFALLGIAALLLAGCTGEPPPPQPTSITGETTTSTSAVRSTSEPPPQSTALPPELVGSWDASTSQSGKLELVLTADGGFRQRSGTFDWSGTATVRGGRITFTGKDGQTSTENWSIKQGTLTLAGQTYLKTDAGAGGALALAGTWMGMDNIFETLIFRENGTYELQIDGQSTVSGTFEVKGDRVTMKPNGRAPITATFVVDDAILTLTSGSGPVQYARSA
ncbi:DUF5640 domain-containing protein [Lentzea sp. NPDC003310]|uniref:DUF5640 domain-containing protein n=1 Tax=Lentzea sp. NPDC003310 TaxID=3154447 RepID=UPI0033BB61D4